MRRLHGPNLAIALTVFTCLVPALAKGQAPSPDALRQSLAQVAASDQVPDGTLRSIRYIIDTGERINGSRYATQSEAWLKRAARYIEQVKAGVDPYPLEKGKIVSRAYPSKLVPGDQGYTVYLPEGYTPEKQWPLVVVLHGGSSNGNLFLGVVLGNNMNWLKYPEYLYDEFEARFKPNAIVVSPDGFGQVLWRWMGEDDIFAVIDDVKRHYTVDADRVVLAGLSNGGLGAYAVGMRHAWQFSMVQAIAGAPSWLQYSGGNFVDADRIALERFSGMHLTENAVNTKFRAYHGRTDTGPMRPKYVSAFEERVKTLGLDIPVTWYDAGHDILYRVHRHGRTFDALAEPVRNRRPSEVRVITGDYRAARQHWLEVTRIPTYPRLAEARAKVEGQALTITTDNVSAFRLFMGDVPLPEVGKVRVVVDGHPVLEAEKATLGDELHLVKTGEHFQAGFPPDDGARVKRPGVAGPLTDAYHSESIHVYGTAVAEDTEALRKAAAKGARGWPLWLWRFQQDVVADTEVTEAMMRDKHLVIYGTPKNNRLLAQMDLPIYVEGDTLHAGPDSFRGQDVGARFIYPNPKSKERYVTVQTGVTTKAVSAGHNLPDFVPDFLIYDANSTRRRPRLTSGRGPLKMGYFDYCWRIAADDDQGAAPIAPGACDRPSTTGRQDAADTARPAQTTKRDPRTTDLPKGEGGQEGPPDGRATSLPITPAPDKPATPRRFKAPGSDQAGQAARRIARQTSTQHNFRAEIPGATWDEREDNRWSIDRTARCHERLSAQGVTFRPRPALKTPVPAPVELLAPIEGVWFRSQHEERPVLLACELAVRLPRLAKLFKGRGIEGVDVMSSYREKPRGSFHTFGLALDIARLWHKDMGWLSVETDYQETPDARTCEGPAPGDRKAKFLRELACDLFRTREVASVLTPNYNAGHRDHFHLDIRPDDPRAYIR